MAKTSLESEQDLLPLIQTYLGAALFRHAQHYELITHQHAQYLDFAHEKVPIHSCPPPLAYYQPLPLTHLNAPIAPNSATVRLVRTLQYNHVLLCLTAEESFPSFEDRFGIMAVVFEHKEAALAWSSQHSFLTKLKVTGYYQNMYRYSPHSTTPLFVTRLQNIQVESCIRFSNCDPEKIRAGANGKFREKNYLQALAEYEFGLGVTHNPEKRRERAILYANSSQCLFELRLYKSALAYAQASVTIDRQYVKGIYKKFACLLQLREFKEVPSVLMALSDSCCLPEFQRAQATYYRHHLHHHGEFDWKELFAGGPLTFGEYFSTKLREEHESPSQTGRSSFVAGDLIKPFEMVLFSKPLIYQKLEHDKFGDDYTSLIAQIKVYCGYEERFRQSFGQLPSQCEFQGHVLRFSRNNPEGMEVNEIHSKCLRCLQRQKIVYAPVSGKEEFIGVWSELYGFKHSCLANCTYLHVKGGLAVFALRRIAPGETLTLDFLNWETHSRSLLMNEKLGKKCNCAFCEWEWDYDFEATGELLYEFYKQEKTKWMEGGFEKISLFFLWELIFNKEFNQIQLIKEYLSILEKYPLWECILNCLKYLRARHKNQAFDLIKGTLKKLFEKYFKLTHQQAVDLLKTII